MQVWKNIQRAQVDERIFKAHKLMVKMFKFLKIWKLLKYVLQSDFYAIDMDDVDIVLGYPWMNLVGMININV